MCTCCVTYLNLNVLYIHGLLQVRIARIFNTYGPRMCIDDGRVVSNFVAQVGFYCSFCFFHFGCVGKMRWLFNLIS